MRCQPRSRTPPAQRIAIRARSRRSWSRSSIHPSSCASCARSASATSGRTGTRRPRRRPRSCPTSTCNWHFIGQLQSNKAKAVRSYASAIHSLDRPSLVGALGTGGAGGRLRAGGSLRRPRPRRRAARRARGSRRPCPHGARPAVARAHDRRTARMSSRPEPSRSCERWGNASKRPPLRPRALSMGMSGDFPEAIREGATHLRIGTAITGNRPRCGLTSDTAFVTVVTPVTSASQNRC